MTDDEVNDTPDGVRPAVLTDGDVQEFLTRHGGTAAAGAFPMRFAPEDGQPHPGNRVFRAPVELPDGRYLVISFSFGQDNADAMLAWKPVWHALEGPVTRQELEGQ